METQEPYRVNDTMEDLRQEPERLPAIQDHSPASLMMAGINKGLDLDKLERMLQLQKDWEANEARKSYHEAMARFAENIPEIEKDRHVEFSTQGGKAKTSYSHASLGNAAKKIQEHLSPHGLHASWRVKQDATISVTCRITHELGHFEEITLSAAADDSGSKNSIQAIGSTISYLERYTLFALTGVAAKDQDDDGNLSGEAPPEFISKEQAKELYDLIQSCGDKAEFVTNKVLEVNSIETMDEMLASEFERAKDWINKAIKKGKK